MTNFSTFIVGYVLIHTHITKLTLSFDEVTAIMNKYGWSYDDSLNRVLLYC